MSRAMNLTAAIQDVTALCEKHSVNISTIESLPSGGTRVVLRTAEDVKALSKWTKNWLIAGDVVRSSLYVSRQRAPLI